MKLLEVKNLSVTFDNMPVPIKAVNNISFDLQEGEILSIIGESGSGKSVTAKSLISLIDPRDGCKKEGEILFNGSDISRLKPREICKIRGNQISMIFQEPMTALNPVMSVYDQVNEIFKIHRMGNKKDNRNRIIDILKKTNIPDPEHMLKKYPFELSGGLRQRIAIAMAVVCEPQIIIADEPTTALDVTTQAEILALLKGIAKDIGCSVILITHDLGVVAETATRIIVMYKGKIVEHCSALNFFDNCMHPYSKGLMDSRPSNFNGRYYEIKGSIEKSYDEQKGCPFADRCTDCMDTCRSQMPQEMETEPSHYTACWKFI